MQYNEKKNILKRFYRNLQFAGFKTIDETKQIELDNLVSAWYDVFHKNNINKFDLAVLVSYRLIFDLKLYDSLSGDEIAYFFIKIVDPDLIALECYEAGNTKKEIRDLLLKNLGFCDTKLIFLEKYYNNYFHVYDINEIWALDRIKR